MNAFKSLFLAVLGSLVATSAYAMEYRCAKIETLEITSDRLNEICFDEDSALLYVGSYERERYLYKIASVGKDGDGGLSVVLEADAYSNLAKPAVRRIEVTVGGGGQRSLMQALERPEARATVYGSPLRSGDLSTTGAFSLKDISFN